ncbi:Crp/Fnr family transcriptional regulator [Granulicella sibirica]|uniref:Crp/Fnr family transcriptional regulator n=1 Tax=Granulicella sibirica TaxID=2479048 RepID=UPI001008BEDB|nr:Crp/Fnr family transcriptional regulator [Granulicella sibirica]
MRTIAYKNSLLRTLDADSIARLQLRPIIFELGHEIESPGHSIEHLFFLEEGMASMTNTFSDGSQVEVGMFGYEGVIGVSGLMGTKRSLNRVYTQIEGRGFSCSLEAARREFGLGQLFQSLALRYVQAQLLQAMQSAGCNAKHRIEQRLARWLLLCADRAHSNTFRLSQEYIADMLGSTRPSVSVAAGLLKEEALIDYSRGLIRILDVEKLERRSCECYRIIKDHLDNYTEFDSGILAEQTI